MALQDAAYEDELDGPAVSSSDVDIRAGEQRTRAARYRAQAAEHRTQGARDRQAAADDREQGSRDRRQALADREALARQIAISETDVLTGARTRLAGLADLDHELDRCRRTDDSLIVAYVDVVGLKTLNDSQGHAAGDDLLKRVVTHIQAHLRSYDLIIRLGGDEFLCAMSSMTLSDARRRLGDVAHDLAASSDAGAIRTGFAELVRDETATQLVARADAELIAGRR
ncbi:MAG: hypothetical protein QOG15_2493 [Solirubrobacteraceae bacterium]|jgi:diguanylate cyclase (GGDEF)-like protein|nr:hypothetical protein [Solirubrobacteraceae bacterium]